MKTITGNPWHMCEMCGDFHYPNIDKEKLNGITVMNGTCPVCRKDNQTLIPISDFEYASGDESKWD